MIALVKSFSSSAAETNSTSTTVNTNGPTLDVRGYLVEGNTVLRPEQFAILTNYTGPETTFPRVREGLGALQLLYRDLGFATVGVTLPKQKLTNGIVHVKVVEGKLNNIIVTGNHYYSSNNIRRALPSLTTNILLNTKWFQPELDQANANADRQIYPVVTPGPDPGTSDLTLKVKDRLPLHGHIEINDKSTPGTPLLRVDSAIQYNNLWQLNHQIGLEYNFSPQSMKTGSYSPNVFDQPMVASYSGFYRIPLGFGPGLREEYDRLPVDFGYDQVTHKFNLPPATGYPELTIYASRSASDTPPRYGPLTNIFTDPLGREVIDQQFAQRNLTFTEDVGTRLTVPIREFAGIHSSLLLGFDFKSFESQTFTTNLSYFRLYSTNSDGSRVLVTNQTIALGANKVVSVDYLPFSFGWAGARADKWGTTDFTFNDNLFLSPLASSRKNFQILAGSKEAGGNYTTVNAGITREQKLPRDWSVLLRANGQWSSAPLINNEQFALGGTAGARGYQEGLHYGDTGWRTLFDLCAPPVNVGYLPLQNGDSIPASLRCSWFMDYGQAFRIDRTAADAKAMGGLSRQEWGTGFSAFLTAGEHFDARLTLGWALLGTPENAAGSAQAYFSVGCQF
ncbi:MAG TPA: ShlB/FhaC/HecB family hemolysin secretion/activation protein [Verrucomicrobiae bacterium]|nr:ShlB/FhaC/HecB family hemolysin secretion/activation protein [Verrucomicrobiae bacterium]